MPSAQRREVFMVSMTKSTCLSTGSRLAREGLRTTAAGGLCTPPLPPATVPAVAPAVTPPAGAGLMPVALERDESMEKRLEHSAASETCEARAARAAAGGD